MSTARFRRLQFAIATASLFMAAAPPASAHLWAPGPGEQPETLVRDGLASPYGRALVAEFGQSLRAAADPACLNAKGLILDQMEASGEALALKWGTRTLTIAQSLFDTRVYERSFAGGIELEKLKQQPRIRQYLELERPIRLARMLDFIFEQFDRHNMLSRIKIAPVSPVASGNEELMQKNPTEEAEQALKKFNAANSAGQMKRFFALYEQSAAAFQGSLIKEQAIRVGPGTFYRGVEVDLAELCVGTAR